MLIQAYFSVALQYTALTQCYLLAAGIYVAGECYKTVEVLVAETVVVNEWLSDENRVANVHQIHDCVRCLNCPPQNSMTAGRP